MKLDNFTIIGVLAFVLVFLFLLSFGPIITGNIIFDLDKTDLSHYPYPFVKNSGYNSFFIVLPNNYNTQELLSARDIAQSLMPGRGFPPEIITVSELDDDQHNLIFIGNPCNSEPIKLILNTKYCTSNLKQGQGMLYLTNTELTSSLVVTGYDSESTRKAALVLGEYNFYPLYGRRVLINGDLNQAFFTLESF